jgi:hypothetical protein
MLPEASAPTPIKTILIVPPGRHSRKCTVCHSPFRHLIELSFVSWRRPSIIARRFGINHRATIYHHAHATHLFEFRQLIAYNHPPSKQRQYEMRTNPILVGITNAQERSARAGSGPRPPEMSRSTLPHRLFNRVRKTNRNSIAASVGIRRRTSQRISKLRNLKSGKFHFSASQKFARQPSMRDATPHHMLGAIRSRLPAAPPGGSQSRHL